MGYADTIGMRNLMEDDFIVRGKFRGRDDEEIVALFDGHGGDTASKYAAIHLHKIIETKLNLLTGATATNVPSAANLPSSVVEEVLKSSFIEIHETMRKQAMKGGTTALVALILGEKLYVANAGDCRAVLCQNERAVRLSRDHKPGDAAEHKRIDALGGYVTTTIDMWGNIISRIKGQLSVSRSLGDFSLNPYVIPEPEIQIVDLGLSKTNNSNNNDNNNSENGNTTIINKFLVLACDGLWDILSDEDAVNIANSFPDPEVAAQKLRDYAYTEGSKDNISV